MTKAAALYQFFNSFGITAYPAEDVPDDAIFPWLTYETIIGSYGDLVYPTVELWYYGESNVPINAKAQEIANRCKNGAYVACDGGGMVVYCGMWTALKDDADDKIKRRMSDFEIEYYTNE